MLTDEEIKAAYPKTTQTIEIESFVSMAEIPFVYLERPYYLSPIGRGEKVYALLRETLLKTGRVGIARVVIQTKQHLAALVPSGPVMVLNLLRWGHAIRSFTELDLPAEGTKGVGLTAREMSMAEQLVEDMNAKWDPLQFRDEFTDEVLALVRKKVEAVEPKAAASNIVDLTELLQRSLRRGEGAAPAKSGRHAAANEPKAGPSKPRHGAKRHAA